MSDNKAKSWQWRRGKRTRVKNIALFLIKAIGLAGLLFVLFFFSLVLFLPLPEPDMPQATKIFDANGHLLSSIFEQNRVLVTASEMTPHLRNAIVASEDQRFYNHYGIDPQGLARAMVRNIKAGRIVEGGSTITQQVARNLFLSQEVTIRRKFMEMVYTIKLEMRYSKEEILTMYLNIAYLGHGAYGCEVASQTYFGKSARDLTLSEAALLTGVAASPENYSPYHDYNLSRSRKNMVLSLMREQGYITTDQENTAKEEEVVLAGLPERTAPYFVDYILYQIRNRHPEIYKNLYRGGYQIHTTLDVDIQRQAEIAFLEGLPSAEKDAKGISQPQGTLVAMEPSTGYIKAMIGGRKWEETQLNRAYQVRRQPGSAFKIFLYSAVIDSGYPITETQVCEPVEFSGRSPEDKYVPRDVGTEPYHYAPINVRQAVAISDNVVAVKWAAQIGISKLINYARNMGITGPLEPTLPLALGSSEVNPLEMLAGVSTLATLGNRPEPVSILKILERDGTVIEDNSPTLTQVLDPATAYVVTSALRSVLGPGGTAESAGYYLQGRPAAGKTGTTDGQLEAWFVGYTKELAAVVYVGWDDRDKPLSGSGGSLAAPIWAKFISGALAGRPYQDWAMPAGATWIQVCSDTGLLASPWCPETYYEVFKEEYLPEVCEEHGILGPRPGRRQTVPWLEGMVDESHILPLILPRDSMQGPEFDHNLLLQPENESDNGFIPLLPELR